MNKRKPVDVVLMWVFVLIMVALSLLSNGCRQEQKVVAVLTAEPMATVTVIETLPEPEVEVTYPEPASDSEAYPSFDPVEAESEELEISEAQERVKQVWIMLEVTTIISFTQPDETMEEEVAWWATEVTRILNGSHAQTFQSCIVDGLPTEENQKPNPQVFRDHLDTCIDFIDKMEHGA